MPEKTGHPLTTLFLDHARAVALAAEANAILVYADVFKKPGSIDQFLRECRKLKVVLATRDMDLFVNHRGKYAHVLSVPPIRFTRSGQIKMAVLLGFAEGVFRKGDRIVCLSGIADSGVLDTIMFVETQEELEMFASSLAENLTDRVRPEVFERLMGLALELSEEGREGRPLGTLFVVGDAPNVLELSTQMILNPFRGYPRGDRNVLDPKLEETLKEFATIDGAFVISGNGYVESAGTYLRSTVPGTELPRGLGARHQSAAAITAATGAVAIAVSESTGNVTVFHGGKILIEIEKPRPIGETAPAPGPTAES